MSMATFTKYSLKLDSAYASGDRFQIAIQLANLDANAGIIFEYLEEGIRENPDVCSSIYQWYNLFREHNFQVNLVRADTTLYKKCYDLCQQVVGSDELSRYAQVTEKEHRWSVKSRPKLDSTQFNPRLIAILDNIKGSDQSIRRRLASARLSGSAEKILLDSMLIRDSVNLSKIELVLQEFGYPKVQEVGYEHARTVWLVLHHQRDLKVREKYLPLIEAHAAKGLITTFKLRTAQLRLDGIPDKVRGEDDFH